MWLADRRVEELARADVDRLLEEILATNAGNREVPTTCPACRGDLLRTTLPHADLFVSACPNQHGVWLSRAEGERLRDLVGAQGAALARKRHTLKVVSRVLLATLVIVWGAVFLMYGRDPVLRGAAAVAEDLESRRITPTNWPEPDWSEHPLPIKESVIDHHDELLYFRDVLRLLQEGANNRVNMHGVLRTKRTADEYGALLDVYRQRQSGVLTKLKELAVPERLLDIHRHLVIATEQQIVFFEAFVAEKLTDSTTDLGRMLGHPALVTTSRELHTAWDEVRALYPNLDRATGDAIESRLCQFDVI